MNMDGNTMVFRSTREWYGLERGGTKPNTVRLLDKAEYDAITTGDYTVVRIECDGQSFTRDIVWAGKLDWVLGKVLYMVCWKP